MTRYRITFSPRSEYFTADSQADAVAHFEAAHPGQGRSIVRVEALEPDVEPIAWADGIRLVNKSVDMRMVGQ